MSRVIEVIRRGQSGADGSVGLVLTSAKGTNFTAVAGERGYVYRCTSTVTMSLEAAAVLGNGWHCIVDAVGGDVTIDPNGAELIEGTSTLLVEQGNAVLVYTDGVAFYRRAFGATSIGGTLESALVSTSSGTEFTQAIPEGVRRITVILNQCSLAVDTQFFLIRIGDSGGIENAGYLSRSVLDVEGTPEADDRATGYTMHANPASSNSSITAVLERVTATTWHCRHYGIRGNGQTIQGYGTKTLSGDLTQVQLASTGTTAFDGGSVLFRWEF